MEKGFYEKFKIFLLEHVFPDPKVESFVAIFHQNLPIALLKVLFTVKQLFVNFLIEKVSNL